MDNPLILDNPCDLIEIPAQREVAIVRLSPRLVGSPQAAWRAWHGWQMHPYATILPADFLNDPPRA